MKSIFSKFTKQIFMGTLTLFVLSTSVTFAAPPAPQDFGLDTFAAACEKASTLSIFPANLKLCATYVFAQLAYMFVWLASWLLWAVGQIFNIVILVQNGAFYDQPMVNIGWMIARDVANIFYIFFLLIIAIATILRISGYGAKQLLWKVIISALLVNFSLPIAGLIIDFSNALGNTFYTNIAEESTIPGTGIPTRDISEPLVSGFSPGRLLARGSDSPTPVDRSNVLEVLLNILIAEIFAIIMIVVVSTTLIAAMVLLIVRIVVLWFVLILAPFAFLFWVLPRTSNLSGQWFETLFKHAFFYPAFMFTLYIGITAIKYNVIAKMVFADKDGLAQGLFSTSQFAAAGASFFTQKVQLILNFIILTMFLGAGLLVAQKMSVEGAGAAMKVSKSLGGSARGFAGRVGNNIVAAPLSEKVMSSPVGRAIARVPIARQALKAPAASLEKRKADREKDAAQQASLAKNLAPAAAAGVITGLSARGKAKAFEDMDEKKKARVIQQMNSKQQVEFAKAIHTTDPTKDYERQVAIASGSVEQAMKILHGEERPDPRTASPEEQKQYQEKVNKYVKSLGDKDLAKLREDTVKNDVYFQRSVINNDIDTEKLQNSRDIVDPKARDAFENLTKEINSVTGAIKILHGIEPPAVFDPDSDESKNYQKLMDERVAKLNEKQLSKIKPDTINDPYFQSSMFRSFNANDLRRVAGNADNAKAVKEAVERQLGKTGPELQDFLDHILPDNEYKKRVDEHARKVSAGDPDAANYFDTYLNGYFAEKQVAQDKLINPALLRLAQSGPARSLILEGTPLSRRDVNMGQFGAGGTPGTPPPPPPPPPPTP